VSYKPLLSVIPYGRLFGRTLRQAGFNIFEATFQLLIFLVGNNGLSLLVIQLIMSGNLLPKFLYFLLRLLVRHLIYLTHFFSLWGKVETRGIFGMGSISHRAMLPGLHLECRQPSLPSRTRVQARNIDDTHQMLHTLKRL